MNKPVTALNTARVVGCLQPCIKLTGEQLQRAEPFS